MPIECLKCQPEIELMACTECGKLTDIDLLDGKDDGSGNYNIIACEICYGPGWLPAMESKRDR